MHNLTAKVKISGISRNKILVASILVIILLLSALSFGVISSDKNNPTTFVAEDFMPSQSSNQSIDPLFNDIKKGKSTMSGTKGVTFNKNVPQSNTLNNVIPPITSQPGNTIDNNYPYIAKLKYQKQQIDTKYSSFTAKSLIFAQTPFKQSDVGMQNGSSTPVIFKNAITTVGSDSANITDHYAANMSGNSIAEERKQFLDKVEANNSYLDSTLQKPRSIYELKAGSVIPAIMLNGLNSDLPGQVVALVRQNVYDTSNRQYLLIPQGAKLIGLYDNNILYGQERVLVAWNRLIYPNGDSINLKAMPGTDLEGYSGFYDKVDNKYLRLFGASFVMGVITGVMQYSQNNTNANVQSGGIGISTNNSPTVTQTLAGSLGQQLGQTGLAITQKNLNIQPTLIIKPNYPFNIMVTADMILKPYVNK